MGTGVVDEVHIVHPRRTRRHAAEAGQAAIDMLDDFAPRRLSVLQHLLGKVDAAARGIILFAEQLVGRTGRRTEAAMHASPQNLVDLRDIRIGKLSEAEGCLHTWNMSR